MESSKTAAVQSSERKQLNTDEAKARLERRRLDKLMVHALKISGGDLAMVLTPAALGDYKEQFVTLDAAVLNIHIRGYCSCRNPLISRHANSMAQQVMRTGIMKQGGVKAHGMPLSVKKRCTVVKHFVMVPVDIGTLPCPILFVANPKVSLAGKLSDDRVDQLLSLTSLIAKFKVNKKSNKATIGSSEQMSASVFALKKFAIESQHAIVSVNLDGLIRSLNPAAAKLFSCKPRHAVGIDFSRYLSPRYFMPTLQRLSQSYLNANKSEKVRLSHRSVTVLDESGEEKFVATSAFYSMVDNQVSVTFVFSHPSAIRRSLLGQTTIANLVDTGSMGVVEFDLNWQCESSNEAWSQLSGLSAEASKGAGWTQAIHEEDLMEAWVSLGLMQNEAESYSGTWRIKQSKGTIRWMSLHASAVVNELNHTTGFLLVCQDVSSAHQSQQQIKQASTHDALTGLLNRTDFLGQLQLKLNKDSQRSDVSLLIVKADGLREINDSLGQGVGDEALRQFSRRLQATLDRYALCGRLGGSQFAVALMNSRNLDAVADTISKISKCTNERIDAYGHSVVLNVSLGFASASECTYSYDALLKQAQVALIQSRTTTTPPQEIQPVGEGCDRAVSNAEYLPSVEPRSDVFSIACMLRSPSEGAINSGFEASLIRKLCKQADIMELS